MVGQTCHPDRAYVSGFIERKGMEKGREKRPASEDRIGGKERLRMREIHREEEK